MPQFVQNPLDRFELLLTARIRCVNEVYEKVAVVNLRAILSGDLHAPKLSGDSILMDGGRIAAVGSISNGDVQACDVVLGQRFAKRDAA